MTLKQKHYKGCTMYSLLGFYIITAVGFLFAAFEAANFQIDFFGNPVMRIAE